MKRKSPGKETDDMKDDETVFHVKHEVPEELVLAIQGISGKRNGPTKRFDTSITKQYYSVNELEALDGPSLCRLFTFAEKLPGSGFYIYKCQISGECHRSYSGSDENECRELILAHLLNHVESLVLKAKRNPKLFENRKFIPCIYKAIKQEKDCVLSSPNQGFLPARNRLSYPVKQEIEIDLTKFPMTIQSPPPDAKDDFSVHVPEHFLANTGSKEALLSAVKLIGSSSRNVIPSEPLPKTRYGRKLKLSEKKKLLLQQRQEELKRHFRNQPKVLLRDIQKSKKLFSRKLPEVKEVSPPVSNNDGNQEAEVSTDDSSSESDSSDSERAKRKRKQVLLRKKHFWGKRTTLSSTLRQRKFFESKVQKSDSLKESPSAELAIAVSTACENADQKHDCGNHDLDNINPTDQTNEEQHEFTTNSSSVNAATSFNETTVTSSKLRHLPVILRRRQQHPPTSTSGPCILADEIVSDKKCASASDSTTMADALEPHDSDQVASDHEDKTINSPSKKKIPRKQNLSGNLKEDEVEKAFLESAMFGIENDHNYTKAFVWKSQLCQTNRGVFVKLLTPDEYANRTPRRFIAKQSERIYVKRPADPVILSEDTYHRVGPSSRQIEPASDPKIKAKALRLISELRHKKPKEVMVCTKRLRRGQPSFLVQDFYSCEICGKNFTAPNSLYGHYRGHAGIKPFRCNVCGRTFTRSHSLTYHQMIHANTARFNCKYCNKKFRHPTHFKEHLNKHTGAEPYRCLDCQRRFKTRNTYRRHMIAKHGKKLTPKDGLPPNSEIISVRTQSLSTNSTERQ